MEALTNFTSHNRQSELLLMKATGFKLSGKLPRRDDVNSATQTMKPFAVSVLIVANIMAAHNYDADDSPPHQDVDWNESYDRTESRMRNGTATDFREYPYFAMIMRRPDKKLMFEQHCGGVFITPQVVMTCAHCLVRNFKYWRREDLRVRYGMNSRHDTNGDSNDWVLGFEYRVEAIYVHPIYLARIDTELSEFASSFDMALLKLEKPIKHVNIPVKLPNPFNRDIKLDFHNPVYTTFVAAGDPGYENADDWRIKKVGLWLYLCQADHDDRDNLITCAYGRQNNSQGCGGNSCHLFCVQDD